MIGKRHFPQSGSFGFFQQNLLNLTVELFTQVILALFAIWIGSETIIS